MTEDFALPGFIVRRQAVFCLIKIREGIERTDQTYDMSFIYQF